MPGVRNPLAGADQNWWQAVPPDQRDWWMRRLNQMPYADPKSFRDDIFVRPNALGTETLNFDRMGANEQPWVTEGRQGD